MMVIGAVLSELINLILKDQLIFPLQANSTIPKFYSFEMYLLILLQALKIDCGFILPSCICIQNVYNLDCR